MPDIGIVHNNCSGCAGCSVVCPVGAIKLALNKRGFYQAIIDNNKCIDCKKCEGVCPSNFKYEYYNKINSHEMLSAVTCDEKIHAIAASGGIATTLSFYAISNQMKVVGAYYDIDTNKVRHTICSNREEVLLCANSKYLQSDCVEALKESLTDKESKYLIIGTPCQIFAAKQIIEKHHAIDRYLLIDFFCHGVPSYLLWDRLIKECSSSGKIVRISFRDHLHDCEGMWLQVQTENKVFLERRNRSLFYQFFDDNVVMNDPCNNCKLSQFDSCADLRIGDIREDSEGKLFRSRVILLTERGKTFFDSAKGLFCVEEYDKKQEFSNNISDETKKARQKALQCLAAGYSLKRTSREYFKEYSIKKKLFKIANRNGWYSLYKKLKG